MTEYTFYKSHHKEHDNNNTIYADMARDMFAACKPETWRRAHKVQIISCDLPLEPTVIAIGLIMDEQGRDIALVEFHQSESGLLEIRQIL